MYALAPSVTLSPSPGREGCWDLTPGSIIGAMTLPGLAVMIRPKILMDRVLFLLSYALDPRSWKNGLFHFEARSNLLEAIVPGFVRQVGKAFRRGLLQGYRVEEDALMGLRGRLRFDDQLRRRFGRLPPVEVRFDEFTVDIEPNRLILAAVDRLEKMRLRSQDSRRSLAGLHAALERVSLREYPAAQVPEIAYDRLNEHYRGAVELARLILRSVSFDLRHGGVQSSAFLLDMNVVFETFVVTALREALGVSHRQFPQGASDRNLWLDQKRAVSLKPDLSWWEGNTCHFVGDVKYKRTAASGGPNADIYQLLAYTIATRLPGGLLIYAAGEGEPAIHEVHEIGKRLEVCSLDLSGVPTAILMQVGELAERIRASVVAAKAGAASPGSIGAIGSN